MQELTFMLPYYGTHMPSIQNFPHILYFIMKICIIQNARVVSNTLSLIFYEKPGVCFIIIIS